MNKTKALDLMTALVNEGVNVTLSSTGAHDENTDTEYNLYVTLPYGSTLADMRPAQRVLDNHDAVLELPSFTVTLNEEIEQRDRDEQQAIAEVERQQAEYDALEAAKAPEIPSSEKMGGASGDFAQPEGDES